MLSKSLSGEELALALIRALSTSPDVKQAHLVVAVRIGAAINGSARRILKVVCLCGVDNTSFSHTINLVSSLFELATLDAFMQW